jgi:anti-anti-sigma factor
VNARREPAKPNTVTAGRFAGVTVIDVCGEHDLPGLDALTTHLDAALAESGPVVVDLADTVLLDSAAVRALLGAAHAAEEAGRPFVICAPSGRFPRQVLALLGVSSQAVLVEHRRAAFARLGIELSTVPDAGGRHPV